MKMPPSGTLYTAMAHTGNGLPRDKVLYDDDDLVALCRKVVARAANGEDDDNDDKDNDNDARCYNVWVDRPSGERGCRTREG